MEQHSEPIKQLAEIRDLMERSSRFISLSGLSGVSAGVIALLGASTAFFVLDFNERCFNINQYFTDKLNTKLNNPILFLVIDALIILVFAIAAGIYFTTRKARKKGLKVWDSATKRLVINLAIPLAAGGIYCIILFLHGLIYLVAPATLIFYGLALLNAAKYTLHEVKVLGIIEIILGLMASWLVVYGLLFWAVGFGVMHIVYGLMMYFRYDAVKPD
jgi:hypothetical protein